MKKTDIAIVILLFILLVAWVSLSPRILSAPGKVGEPVGQVEKTEAGTNEPAIREARPEPTEPAVAKASEVAPETGQAGRSNAAGPEASCHAGNSAQMISLAGPGACATISSWGGGIVAVRLEDYLENQSTNALVMDFTTKPSLVYCGLPGLSANYDFAVSGASNTIRVSRDTEEKLRFVRLISFAKDYVIKVTDEFTNLGSQPVVIPEHSISIGPMRNNKGETASMGYSDLGIDSQARRGGEHTRYWGNGGRTLSGEASLAESFLPKERRGGCTWFKPALTTWLDPEFQRTWVSETDWVAVKNKFFVQVLMPKKDEAGRALVMHAKRTVAPATLRCTAGGLKGRSFEIRGEEVTIGSAAGNSIRLDDPSVLATNCFLVREGWNYAIKRSEPSEAAGRNRPSVAERTLVSGDTVQIGDLAFMFADGERPDVQRTWAPVAVIEEVSADMIFEGRQLAPGESFSREIEYFVGPKKYPLLRDLGKTSDKDKGKGCDKIMEFGFWEVVCVPLLWIINALHSLAPNYGVAIILLTILIRLVFWPVMQKSAENSRKMQELQPQLVALKAQYKDDQQQYLKKQQELFKQNKVSVLGGCLPMLIQLPILFSLFVVLRSAVELRGAEFLWIKDLSEAERLFPGIIPIWPHHVNLLPILMTVVQIWQMKITPTPGDQQMQKMMLIFMPLFMLYLLYDMASGLVLYWTVSQFLAIVQIILEKKKKHQAVTQVVATTGKR